MAQIRIGTEKDLPSVLQLIKELAIYEKAEHEVINTVENLRKDGFGPQPLYGFLVADEDGAIVGLSFYYFRYSTWKGKRLFLEDLIVTESHRGRGLGKQLFEQTLEIARAAKCTGMMWQVLDWNEPAIRFYEKFQTRFDQEWVNCCVDF